MLTLFKYFLSAKFKRSIKEQFGVPSLHWSLQNLKKMGYCPKYVIDIGAYEGKWAKDFIEVYPNSTILMIEAQKSKEEYLDKICASYPNLAYKIALLSNVDDQELYFIENETASYVAEVKSEKTYVIRSSKLDTLINENKSPFPDFLKLDVQGHELQVLFGAEISLKFAEFCLIEVSFLKLSNEPLLLDILSFMDKHQFQAYDICQFMRRPFDQALYQLDLLFIKKNSKLISDSRWI